MGNSGAVEDSSPFKNEDTGSAKFFLCNFTTGADDQHLSSTGFAASAHGWWEGNSVNCPEYAGVEVRLWGYYCGSAGVGPETCFWRFLTSSENRVRSGGGSGRRATARMTVLIQCFHDALRRFGDPELSGFQVSILFASITRSHLATLVFSLNWVNVIQNGNEEAIVTFRGE